MSFDIKQIARQLATIKVLIVDDDHYMRKVVRALLMSIGVRDIHEAIDGLSGLDAIRNIAPDVVLLDWEMPGLDGAGFLRIVRQPETFPYPAVPVIMLTGHGERSRVIKAVEVGVNEFLLKPVSSKALFDRLVSVLANPRPVVRQGNYYGPAPRRVATVRAEAGADVADLVMLN
ncbi:MAG: PleD family two-component system response regulator [Pseudolabrys sp.]